MDFHYPMAGPAAREALRLGLRDRTGQFHDWLSAGQLAKVIETVGHLPAALADLLPIIADPGSNMNVRLGASAALERYAGTAALEALVPALGMLAADGDARVRADACYILGLCGTKAARDYLEAHRNDPDEHVRGIVADGLEESNRQED